MSFTFGEFIFMTPDDINILTTPNALEASTLEKRQDILNQSKSYLLSDNAGTARQMQAAIQSIHYYESSLRAVDLEKKVLDLQKARTVDRWILFVTTLGVFATVIGICATVCLSRSQ